MLVPTLIMAGLALILLGVGYANGQGQHIAGLKNGAKMTLEVLPLLVFAFVLAGMVQVLIPQELIAKWVGAESGWRGIVLGTVAGGLSPGGPYVSLPIAAGFLRAGAGVGTMVAYLTGWSLWAVARIPMDVGVLGWKFAGIRIACTFFFPPIAGLLANLLFRNVSLV
ncbi:MAG TPA: permease [bacterium]|nr:permease [bacterium]